MTSRIALHRYAVITSIATFALLLAGSLVTSTDSGLAVPDWPLSYGTLFPPMVGGIRFEHGHRLIAGAVAVLILILAVWIQRAESRRWVRRLGYSALIGVLLQALLGGLTVLLLLPPAVSIAHACLGQTVFCLTVSIAYATSLTWDTKTSITHASRGRLVAALALLVAVLAAGQLILGAVIRHTGYAVAPHLLNGSLLVLMSGSLLWVVTRQDAQARAPYLAHAWRLCSLVVLQVMLGVSVLLHRGVVTLRSGHVVLGALILAQAVIFAWEAVRRTRPLSPVAARGMSVEAAG